VAKVIHEYDLKADAKRRVTLRSADYSYYHAREYADGRILLEPRELRAPDSISRLTLRHMDEAVRNFSTGKVGDEFEPEDVKDLIAES
jgi:hypothetical protein